MTPKQIYFLGELSRRLEAKGHDVFKTTRRYREVNELLELKGVNAAVVGKHGGPTLEGKLVASAQRIARLARIIGKLQPDLSIAFASPEAARTAFGLAIPHYTINDSPHSVAVARLTISFSKKLFAPKIIPQRMWVKLGANPEMIVPYNALDPIVWLKTFLPNRAVLNELGLDGAKPIVVFRAEEALASYLLGHVSEKESVTIPIIRNLLERCGDSIQVVVLPRYAEQTPAIKATFHNRVIVPEKVVDGPSLLFFSSVFVGAGGTMTAEAALLGVPAISCYPAEPTLVDNYLIKQGLVCRVVDHEKAVKGILQILQDLENVRKVRQEKAKQLTSKMEDPIEVITKTIEAEISLS